MTVLAYGLSYLFSFRFAAAHIKEVGPTLSMSAEYSIPDGSGADPAIDEEGNEVVDDVSLSRSPLLHQFS